MREDEAGRPRVSWRRRPWFKPISTFVASASAALQLATDAAGSLAARKNNDRDDRGGGDKTDKDRDRGDDRDQDPESKSENERKADRKDEREDNDKASRDGDGDNRDHDRGRHRQRQNDDASDLEAGASTKQKANRSQEAEQTNDNPEDTEEPDDTEDPEETDGGGGGGGGGRGGRGGRGDGGGNDAGNAGSELFDSPLATKARRRAKDFENADRDDDEERIIVDVDPDGESVYETDTILFATGPEGVEIQTGNITFFADPAPPPEPLPGLDLPVREPGYPFGEDFPFGDFPFGVATVTTDPTAAPEPADPGDTAPDPARRADPVPAADEPAPASSDGGDNTMDFSS
jgi:hypothetical protein